VNTQDILIALDAEIVRLQQARALIAASSQPARRGRPPKATAAAEAPARRVLSPEARKKIAAAQRKRWAKQKAAQPVQVTKVPPKKKSQPRTRPAKQEPVQNALSNRSDTVAAGPKT
jgi:hypothetical protein